MSDQRPLSYADLFEAINNMMEVVNAMVSRLKSEGFSDEQARIIATGLFASVYKQQGQDGESA